MQEQESEFVPEEEVEEGPALIKKLRERLKKTTQEKQEYLEGWQRARADFVNFKKEEAAREGERHARMKISLIERLIPALDSFEMAFRLAQTTEMNLLHKQLLDALRSLGVEPYGKVGEKFDPRKHEALRQVHTDLEEQDHTIESVERSGYSIDDKIIRPAQVTIWQKS